MIVSLISRIKKIAPVTSLYQFGRFLIVGVTSAALEMLLLIALVERFYWSYLYANILAFLITNILNYTLSRGWVFTSDNNKIAREFFVFMIFVSVGLAINQLFLWLFVEYGQLDYKISKMLAILFTVTWNFLTRRHFVFKSKP
jgi:putative flippase GtrA